MLTILTLLSILTRMLPSIHGQLATTKIWTVLLVENVAFVCFTLPSETHTSWFCCCWIISLSAPNHPSFMLFKLIVAEHTKSSRGTEKKKRLQFVRANNQHHLQPSFAQCVFVKEDYVKWKFIQNYNRYLSLTDASKAWPQHTPWQEKQM